MLIAGPGHEPIVPESMPGSITLVSVALIALAFGGHVIEVLPAAADPRVRPAESLGR